MNEPTPKIACLMTRQTPNLETRSFSKNEKYATRVFETEKKTMSGPEDHNHQFLSRLGFLEPRDLRQKMQSSSHLVLYPSRFQKMPTVKREANSAISSRNSTPDLSNAISPWLSDSKLEFPTHASNQIPTNRYQ